MKYLLPYTCALLIVSSCEYKEICDTDDPTRDLAWLKTEIDGLENDSTGFSRYVYIRQGNYKGSTVFVTMDCCSFCSLAPPAVKNCNGQTLFSLNFNDPRAKDVSFSKIIWKGKNFSCSQ
jgi:hypothetical protein